MLRFLAGRTLQGVVSMIVISILVFGLTRLTGDPIALLAPPDATPTDIERIRASYGLADPLWQQYLRFAGNAVQGDFGTSVRFNRPVGELIAARMPATLQLALCATLVAVMIAIPAGVYSAAHRGGKFDYIVRGGAAIGQAVPNFWLGVMLVLVFAVHLRWLPTSGRGTLAHLVLPSITLGLFVVAGIARLTRSAMLDALSQEYVKFARVKGVPERSVIWKHSLRNAALPVLTFGAIVFVGIVNGSVVVETIFAWPGMGSLVIDAVQTRDFPIVQAVVLIASAMYIVANLLVDILYSVLDPKIRSGS